MRASNEAGNEELPPRLLALARELGALLGERGIAASPRLPLESAGRVRLHRFQLAGGGELAVVVATGPALEPVATSLTFDDEVEVEPIEPPGAEVRLPRGTPLAVAADDRH